MDSVPQITIFDSANSAFFENFVVAHVKIKYRISSAKIGYFSEFLKILSIFNLMFLLL